MWYFDIATSISCSKFKCAKQFLIEFVIEREKISPRENLNLHVFYQWERFGFKHLSDLFEHQTLVRSINSSRRKSTINIKYVLSIGFIHRIHHDVFQKYLTWNRIRNRARTRLKYNIEKKNN